MLTSIAPSMPSLYEKYLRLQIEVLAEHKFVVSRRKQECSEN